MRTNASPCHRAWPAVLLLVLVVAGYQGASTFATAAAAREPQDKIDAGLRESLAAKGEGPFWVILREEANLAPALGMGDRERGEFVVRELQAVARRSQAGLRELLDRRGAGYRPFWIANAIRVTGDQALLRDVAARPDVKAIHADDNEPVIESRAGRLEPRGLAPEWGLDLIGAVKVWTEFGIRGAGIVVANVDTGVQYNHPALVTKYRGNLGGGNFDHNYNWFDATNVCGNPSTVPCDNVGTGTHTMGTMVGEEGSNQIGVAPEAKWIAVKGCASNTCSNAAVLAAGEWLLAPRDLNGQNPQPHLRPDVVTVSWGVKGGNNFYLPVINAWYASGIFPAAANGDRGPECGSSRSPGDYVKSYSSGAFDISKMIAPFSSRGPSLLGFPKPDVASPGVDVRSSLPTNTYGSMSGTAMASAHVAGTVALMWEYTPTLKRVIGTTRHLLDNTARNMPPDACGGVPDQNNAWGDGRLNAYNAVRTSPNP